MVNRIIKIIFMLILLFNSKANAEEPTTLKQSIDHFMSTLMQEFDISSATSIAVVSDKKTLYQQSFGYADIENKTLATNDTLFYIASATKPLFALTVLHSLNNSNYDTSLSLKAMFPEISFSDEIQAEKITLKDLLTHTSGLDDQLLSSAVSTSGIHTQQTKLLMLAQLFASDETSIGEFDYTNLGYNIVSIWYERTFNIRWQNAIAQTVFEPLNMAHSTAYVSEAKQKNWLIAKPYSFFNLHPNQALYLTKQDNTMHAAGGVISTSADMAKFITAQFSVASSELVKLNASLIHLAQQPIASLSGGRGDFSRTAYAYGWYTGQYKDNLTYHHFGSFDGFRPHLSFMPEQKVGIVILNNEGVLNDKLTDIIADFIYSKLLTEKDVEARIAARVAKLKNMALKYRDNTLEKEHNYTLVPWLLSAKKQHYVGKYHHPMAGTISITLVQDEFLLTWGNLHSSATPFKEKDQMRIKFRPTRGQYMQFYLRDNKPIKLIYDNIEFSKL